MKKNLKHFIKSIYYLILYPYYGSCGIGSRIQKPRTILAHKKHIFLGRNVFIRKFARIEPIVSWHEEKFNPRITIGDNVTIEQNLHLTCAKSVEIGAFSSISSYVLITDIDHEYSDISLPVLEQRLQVKPTAIGKNCLIGTGAKIMAGVHIGEHSVIGANAVVTHDIPPYSVAAGIPAVVIKKFDFEKQEWCKINESIIKKITPPVGYKLALVRARKVS